MATSIKYQRNKRNGGSLSRQKNKRRKAAASVMAINRRKYMRKYGAAAVSVRQPVKQCISEIRQ